MDGGKFQIQAIQSGEPIGGKVLYNLRADPGIRLLDSIICSNKKCTVHDVCVQPSMLECFKTTMYNLAFTKKMEWKYMAMSKFVL